MSSLRLDTLRLVWLETFIQVADEENISEVARNMSIDQSTVSRHMKELQAWLGKDLIVPGVISDPEHPGRNVGQTEAGREFYLIAASIIEKLTGFRTEEARREELLARMEKMLATMQADRDHKHPSRAVQSIKDKLELHTKAVAVCREAAPVGVVEGVYPALRRFFATYENQVKPELLGLRKKRGPKKVKVSR